MEPGSTSLITGWENFYVIIGSAAGALTGLQFVVIAFIAQTQAARSMREIRAFGTPTVMHFCAALLLAGIMSAPWRALSDISYCIGVCGAVGFLYSLSTSWHAYKAVYQPDLEDWIWYAALPLVAYMALLVAAIVLWFQPIASLFITAATALLFVFVGIHNSWDTVTYVAVRHSTMRHEPDRERAGDRTTE